MVIESSTSRPDAMYRALLHIASDRGENEAAARAAAGGAG
jgi:hypothetical protein